MSSLGIVEAYHIFPPHVVFVPETKKAGQSLEFATKHEFCKKLQVASLNIAVSECWNIQDLSFKL